MNDCIELFIRYEPRAKSKYEEVRDFLLQKNAKEVSEGFFVFNMNVNDFVSEIWTVLGKLDSSRFHYAAYRPELNALAIRPSRLALSLGKDSEKDDLRERIQEHISFH